MNLAFLPMNPVFLSNLLIRLFFFKNLWIAQKTDKQIPSSAIHLFLVSNLSKSLMVAHFWWATWAICSHQSLKKRKWANCSLFFKHTKKVQKKHLVIFVERITHFCEQKSNWAICSERKSNLFIHSFTVGAESMAHTESMARRRFAADTTAPVHFLKDFFS